MESKRRTLVDNHAFSIGLALLFIGGLVMFVQRRNSSITADEKWSEDLDQHDPIEQFNRPSSAPSFDDFQ